MSKSTALQGTKVIETFSNYTDSMTSNVHLSQGSALTEHFYPYPDRLVPRIESVADDTGVTDEDIKRFINTDDISDTGINLFGIGFANDRIFKKSSIQFGTWTQHAQLTTPPLDETYLYYKRENLYYVNDSNELSKVTRTSGVVTDGELTGLVPSRGTFKFPKPAEHTEQQTTFFCDKYRIWRLDEFVFDQVFTGDLYRNFTALSEYKQYLAIAEYDEKRNKSEVLLWNLEVDSPYVQPFKAGNGEIIYIAELEGNLLSISRETSDASADRERLAVRILTGGGMKLVNYIEPDGIVINSDTKFNHPFTDGEKLYFTFYSTSTNTQNSAIYAVDLEGNLSVAYKEHAGGAVGNTGINGFTKRGNTYMTSWGNSGNISRTKDGEIYDYSYPATFIPVLLTGNLPNKDKRIDSIKIPHFRIEAGRYLEVYVRNTEDNDWTLVKTTGTDEEGTYETLITGIDDGTGTLKPFSKHNEAYLRIISYGVTLKEGIEVKSDILKTNARS